jgi:primosomal protein N' (replication factor Y) (superfamily II helicase)
MVGDVRVGTMVRIDLHGRRVGAWVIDVVDEPATDRPLKPLAKITGAGPTPDIVALTEWGAWRWAGRRQALLRAASPLRAFPEPRPVPVGRVADSGLSAEEVVEVVRIAPANDRLPLILQTVHDAPALIVTPTVGSAAALAGRLRQRGVAVALVPEDWRRAAAGEITVVGARAAAWAPAPDARTIVVLDEHDEALQEERAPTWHARDVCVERARRAGMRCVLVSPCPSLESVHLVRGRLDADERAERQGWAPIEPIDLRAEDPASGLLSRRTTALVRSDQIVLCVLNRTGRARLLACHACAAVARCSVCGAASVQYDSDELICLRCGELRPRVCLECFGTRLRTIRAGTARVRDELEALAGEPVGEVTARTDALPEGRVLVGTEALLRRVTRADVAIFLDFDQELLAPRFRATEQAMALLALASRAVGGRRRGGRVVVQTRMPDHEVLDAAGRGDPGLIVKPETQRRIDLGLPPFAALAAISGAAADTYVSALRTEVRSAADGTRLARAPDHRALCDALAAVSRPPGRMRIEVDPLRI